MNGAKDVHEGPRGESQTEPDPQPESRTRIALLSPQVRDQIAAGEVIERPSAVVKELVENALDAGARRVTIELEEGGMRLVRVLDDGSGMSRADLELAFVAHATSKLFDVADLEHIGSLGFRGEALASMGAVARCRITSRERGRDHAWRIECEGGVLSHAVESGAPLGTEVLVRDLFYNVPARRRFMKSVATELARCLDLVQRLALAHQGVAITLLHDGKRVFDVEAAMDLRARIRRTFGAELESALQAVDARDGTVRLTGYVAPPRHARADTSRQMWFLNGRSLRDKVLLRALKDAYRGFMFDHRQPVAFLELAMDPAQVDVNVHPQKTEVRFRDERRLFGFLVNALRDAVRLTDMATPGARMIDMVVRRDARDALLPLEPSTASFSASPTWQVREVAPRADAGDHARTDSASAVSASDAHASSAWDAPRASGELFQIDRCYIVRALASGFEVIDQHALHERINYEELLQQMRDGAVHVQRLLVPELLELARSEVLLLSSRFEDLARVGVELAVFGETTIAVHGVPARVKSMRVEPLVRDVLALLHEDRALAPERLIEGVLHSASCRAAVMSGDVLTVEEMRVLLERGTHLESDQTCVHGRPTRVRFTLNDLQRAFDRK